MLVKLKKKFRKINRKFFSYFFILVYGQIKILKKDNTNIEVQKINKIDNFLVRKYNYKFLKIKNGRVFTNYVENVSVISNSQLIKDFSFNQVLGKLKNSNNEVLSTGTPKILKKYNGTVAILTQGASGHENYAHWLIDIIPKIKMINSKYPIRKIDYYYFTKINEVQKQSLKILGINSNNFINSDVYRHIKADKLLAVTHPNYFKNTFSYAQSKLPEWIVNYVKKTFVIKKKQKKIYFDKIFINRNDSKYNHCKFINNNEIIEFFKKKKFKILELSKFDFMEQVNIFNNAKIIIGPHGAGLANLIFCKKKTKVIEFKPKTNKNYLFKRISKINNLNYKMINLKHIKNNPNGDMFLKIDKIDEIINF